MTARRQVFLSSTGRDLARYRDAVYRAVEGLDGYHCVRMEDFGARDWEADDFCRAKVGACDVFVAIVGHVRGSAPAGREGSYTEREYDAAVATGRPRLVFVAPGDFPVPADLFEGDDVRARQRAFRERVEGERVRAEFRTEEELARKVVSAIRNWEQEVVPPRPAAREAPAGSGRHTEAGRTTTAIPQAYADALRRVIQLATLVKPPTSEVMVMPEVETVYVPVRVEVLSGARAEERGMLAGENQRTSFHDAWSAWDPEKHGPLVVTGAPGAGKTTLLKHLGLAALAAAAGSRPGPGDVVLPPGTLPVFVRLALLGDLGPGVPDLIASLPPQVDHGLPVGLFKDALDDGRSLLLLDGLDEAADAQRGAELSRWVERVHASFPKARVVVSSRDAAYRAGAVLRVPHRRLSLVALGDEEIRRFLANWYRMIEPPGGAADPVALAGSLADYLLSGELPELRRLASTPLMLLVMALIHRTGGGLPKRRVELYDQSVDILLEHWNKQNQLDYIPAKLGRAVLRPLAFWLQGRRRRRSATLEELVPLLRPELERTPDLPERDPARFLQSVRDRSGIFGGQAENDYAFVHPTFQEFLAAEHVQVEPDQRPPAPSRRRR